MSVCQSCGVNGDYVVALDEMRRAATRRVEAQERKLDELAAENNRMHQTRDEWMKQAANAWAPAQAFIRAHSDDERLTQIREMDEYSILEILDRTAASVEADQAALATVRALISPEAGMATTPFGDGKRYFAEDDIRAALEVTE